MKTIKTADNIAKGSDANETVFNLLEATETNWSVEKKPLIAIGTDDMGDQFPIETESFGIFRSDNNKWLGTTKGQYIPMQNKDLAQTLVESSHSIGEEFRGGTLHNDRKVFYQIAIPDYKVANDTLKRWITAINSHDGSTCIGFGSTNTVIICQNTFNIAYKGIEKFRHTLTAKERIEIAAKELKATLDNDNKIMVQFEKMAETKIDNGVFQSVLKKLFNIDSIADSEIEKLSTRKKNQMSVFNNVMEKELISHGETFWGLFNAVTFYENHVTVAEDKKLDHIMIGGGAKTMQTTFNDIMSHIEKHEKKVHAVK